MTLARLTLPLAAALLTATMARGQLVNYELVTVGDPGNAADANGHGDVPYEYRLGKYEVTIGQYTTFLNAVAKADPNNLYNVNMATDLSIAGIARADSPGSYTYSAIGPFGDVQIPQASAANRPITYVNWFDAARFANWMSNGQPTGAQGPTTTENGAYDLTSWLSGPVPAINATNPNTGAMPLYRIPTLNEWYKAGYYKGGGVSAGWWAYATQSDTRPGSTIGSGANRANYNDGVFSVTQLAVEDPNQNYLTNVGAFSGSPSAYGTFDQWGSVVETAPHGNSNGEPLPSEQIGMNFTKITSYAYEPTQELSYLGFRLAAPVAVPEPSTYATALAGLACGGYSMWRRRKPA